MTGLPSASALPDKGSWQKTSRHELGHLIGMEHGGLYDSLDGWTSAMSTCLLQAPQTAFSQQQNFLARDTAQHLSRLHEPLSDPQLHANVGVENGLAHWSGYNGNLGEVTGSLAFAGQKYASFTPQKHAYNSYMHQTTRLWTGITQVGNPEPSDFDMLAAFQFKESVPSATTLVAARTVVKKLKQLTPANGCNYPDNMSNLNHTSPIVGGWILVNDSGIATVQASTWAQETDIVRDVFAQSSTLDFAIGFEIQLRAHAKSTTSSGTKVAVHFDNIEARGWVQ